MIILLNVSNKFIHVSSNISYIAIFVNTSVSRFCCVHFAYSGFSLWTKFTFLMVSNYRASQMLTSSAFIIQKILLYVWNVEHYLQFTQYCEVNKVNSVTYDDIVRISYQTDSKIDRCSKVWILKILRIWYFAIWYSFLSKHLFWLAF